MTRAELKARFQQARTAYAEARHADGGRTEAVDLARKRLDEARRAETEAICEAADDPTLTAYLMAADAWDAARYAYRDAADAHERGEIDTPELTRRKTERNAAEARLSSAYADWSHTLRGEETAT